jgi:hypothetical protein
MRFLRVGVRAEGGPPTTYVQPDSITGVWATPVEAQKIATKVSRRR